MVILISIITVQVFLPGWIEPVVENHVVRATVVDDHVLLPVYIHDGPFILISNGGNTRGMRLDILDQSLHRTGPPVQLHHGWGASSYVWHGSKWDRSYIRIDRYRLYWTNLNPFSDNDPLTGNPIGALLQCVPLEIQIFLCSSNAALVDQATKGEIMKLVGRQLSLNYMDTDREPGDPRIQFDYWPVKGDRLEMYISGMFRITRGGGRSFQIWKTTQALDPEGMNPRPVAGRNYWETPRAKDWEEGFSVVGVGEDRYFVTHAGRLFAAPSEKSLDFKLKELATKFPIRILIHDTDVNKTYAFTNFTFFEIGNPGKPHPHKIDVPGEPYSLTPQDGLKAMEVIAKCARLARGLPEPVVR